VQINPTVCVRRWGDFGHADLKTWGGGEADMSCGVLVVSPDSHVEAEITAGGADAPDLPTLGQGIAELLRSAGHSVVECDQPQDDGSARGVVEAAWVVLAGVDLVVIVEDPAEREYPTGPLCARARELMTDRGPGGAIVWVPPGVPAGTAAAALLELADSAEAQADADADGMTLVRAAVDVRPLEVGPVPPRSDVSRHSADGPAADRPAAGHPSQLPSGHGERVAQSSAAGGGSLRRTVPEGFRGGRS